MLIINFKNYPQTLGERGVELAKNLAQTAKDFPNVKTVLAVPPTNIFRISQAVDIPIFSQHVSAKTTGQTTGFVIAESLKEAGAVGTLINHSEHPLDLESIAPTVHRCQEIELETVVCASSVEAVKEIKKSNFIAYEPPHLISGQISVTESEPEVIKKAVKAAATTPLLVGAGIHSKKDIQTAIKLGAVGLLVSSDIVLAKSPAKELKELLSGFSR